jgi:uncharacterized phage-like protein YoqJ
MRIAVVGSREFANLALVKRTLDDLKARGTPFTLVSGGAEGVDSAAKEWADTNGVECLVHAVSPEEWAKDDNAGIKRNAKIVDDSEAMLAFWDGESGGTLDSIKRAKNRKGYGKVLVWLA